MLPDFSHQILCLSLADRQHRKNQGNRCQQSRKERVVCQRNISDICLRQDNQQERRNQCGFRGFHFQSDKESDEAHGYSYR